MIPVGIAGIFASIILGRDWARTHYPPSLFWSGFYFSFGLVCLVIKLLN